MWKKIFGPSTNYYGEYSYRTGGRERIGYSSSGDKFKKYLDAWVAEAKSTADLKSREEIATIFGVNLRFTFLRPKDNYKDPAGNYEIVCGQGSGYACFITLQGKSLTSFPTGLPRYDYRMELLDLSDNFLKEIPQEGHYTSINMSGNPLDECLDSIKVNVNRLDLKRCGIKELTPNLFSELKRRAEFHEKWRSNSGLASNVVYEIDIRENPLSAKSITLIEAYAAEGNTLPDFIYDKGEISGLRSSTLANTVMEEISPGPSMDNIGKSNKADRYIPVVNLVLADYKKEIEARRARASEIENDFQVLTNFFGIESAPNISSLMKSSVNRFLKELQPLADRDLHFRECTGAIFNDLFEDKNAAELLSQSLERDKNVTFNKLNEFMLMSKVKKGEFDDKPEVLAQSLRNLFLSEQIKKLQSKSELDFVKWESFLQDELKMDIQKKCHEAFSPPDIELLKVRSIIHGEEKKDLKSFIKQHAIWKEFLNRSFPKPD